nr:recombinase family protein [Microvirga sp.]
MRDLVALSAVDLVYVHAPDRLARSYAHQVLLLEEFAHAGTQVIFLNRPIGSTPEDSLLLQLQGMFAEYERAKVLERSRRGKRHRAQTGAVSVLSRAPFGYRYITREITRTTSSATSMRLTSVQMMSPNPHPRADRAPSRQTGPASQ